MPEAWTRKTPPLASPGSVKGGGRGLKALQASRLPVRCLHGFRREPLRRALRPPPSLALQPAITASMIQLSYLSAEIQEDHEHKQAAGGQAAAGGAAGEGPADAGAASHKRRRIPSKVAQAQEEERALKQQMQAAAEARRQAGAQGTAYSRHHALELAKPIAGQLLKTGGTKGLARKPEQLGSLVAAVLKQVEKQAATDEHREAVAGACREAGEAALASKQEQLEAMVGRGVIGLLQRLLAQADAGKGGTLPRQLAENRAVLVAGAASTPVAKGNASPLARLLGAGASSSFIRASHGFRSRIVQGLPALPERKRRSDAARWVQKLSVVAYSKPWVARCRAGPATPWLLPACSCGLQLAGGSALTRLPARRLLQRGAGAGYQAVLPGQLSSELQQQRPAASKGAKRHVRHLPAHALA